MATAARPVASTSSSRSARPAARLPTGSASAPRRTSITSTPLTDAQAAQYTADGFEVGVHINTGCGDFTLASLQATYEQQVPRGRRRTRAPARRSRSATTASSGATGAAARRCSSRKGMRLDTSYYFWPPSWVGDVPGLFTGSAMPMRFARLDGSFIDVYHGGDADDRRVGPDLPVDGRPAARPRDGPEGFYGAYTVNAHTDTVASDSRRAVVNSALARGVPIVSAGQMLTWLDAPATARFGALSFAGARSPSRSSRTRRPTACRACCRALRRAGASGLTRERRPGDFHGEHDQGRRLRVLRRRRRQLRRQLRRRQQRTGGASTTPDAVPPASTRRGRHRDLQRG